MLVRLHACTLSFSHVGGPGAWMPCARNNTNETHTYVAIARLQDYVMRPTNTRRLLCRSKTLMLCCVLLCCEWGRDATRHIMSFHVAWLYLACLCLAWPGLVLLGVAWRSKATCHVVLRHLLCLIFMMSWILHVMSAYLFRYVLALAAAGLDS